MKPLKYFFPAISCLLLASLLTFTKLRTDSEALASRIAPEILRLHVLANSDSASDQAEKLEVKSLLLEYLQNHLSADASKEETCAYVLKNADVIEKAAEAYLSENGSPYPVQIELAQDYFPAKTYGNMTFPCGTYDALRVTIGSGNGHNWWCVVYPQLCFVDAACAELPARSEELLECSIKKDDYLALLDNRPQISFKFLSLIHPQNPSS